MPPAYSPSWSDNIGLPATFDGRLGAGGSPFHPRPIVTYAETRYEQFNPPELLSEWVRRTGGRYPELVKGYETPRLLERNEFYFSASFDDAMTAPMLCLINTELNVRGIAPAWRRIPRYAAHVGRSETVSLGPARVRKLSARVKRNLMRRWVDLEWLRSELGSRHETHFRQWRDVFSEDPAKAAAAFGRVNRVQSHGGGRYGPLAPHRVLFSLSIPALHKIALTGLIDRDEGKRSQNVRQRVQDSFRPILESLMERPKHPLSREDVERRLVYCEAIELAQASPSDAARIVGWMTGSPVTRQTIVTMRSRIADQCGLTTKAWRPMRGSHA